MDSGPALTTPAKPKELTARLVVLEKNRLLDVALLAAIPAGLAFFAAFLGWHFAPGALGVHVAVLAAVIRFSVARQNSSARPVERNVHVSAEGVVADDVKIPRAQISEGWYQPRPAQAKALKKRPAGSTVQLFDRQKRILFEAEVDDENQATAFLRALGLDASQKRTSFFAPSPMAQRQVLGSMLALGAVLGLFALKPIVNGTYVISALSLLALFMLIPSKIDVGVDGVLLRWLGRRRFFPMSEIVSADAEGETAIRLRLPNGKEEILQTASRKRRGGLYTQRRDVILARIREAQASHRELGPAADVSALVGRAGRTLTDWKTALAALEQADPTYRQAAIREEDLWRVVEDPRAGEDARAGAAILLRKSLDHEGKARVRIAAEATASPKLRVALEAASGESEDAALDALDALNQPQARLRAGGSEGR